jgi:hypothetical protein
VHTTGQDEQRAFPPTPPGDQAEKQLAQVESEWSPAAALGRLMLGFALEGGDQLVARLRQWEQATRSVPTDGDGIAAPRDLQRHTTLGLMLEAETRVGETVESLRRTADEMATWFGRGFDDIFQHWPFKLLRPRLILLRHDFEMTILEWATQGRREEEQSRLMARQATASLVDELLAYLAKNPELRELIEQQGAGLAETAVEGVRERTAAADAVVERLVQHMLRRRPDGASVPPAEGSATSSHQDKVR